MKSEWKANGKRMERNKIESIKKISYFWTANKTKNYKDFESFEMTLSQGNEIVNFIISYFSI